MTEHTDNAPTLESPQRRRPVWVWLRRFLVVLLATVGILLWLTRHPSVPDEPVRLVRGPDGQFTTVDAPSRSSWQLELHAGGIKSNNSLTTTSNESRSGHGGLACRRMVIFNESDHLLMQRVGSDMLQQLKGLQGFEQIDYYPQNRAPDRGELAPDVTVTLSLNDVRTSGLPYARKLDATIVLSAGNTLMQYPSRYFDSLDPPTVQFSIKSTLDHHSISTGIGTRSARHKLAAQDIAKQLATALIEKLNDLRQTAGPLPQLPESFYPPYMDPPELPLPPGEKLELMASYHGLMTSNESLWRWVAQGDVTSCLTELEQRGQAAGWQTDSLQTDTNALPHLRVRRGAEVLTAYPKPKASPEFRIETRVDPDAVGVVDDAVMFVHYVHRMTREEMTAAIEGLMDERHSAKNMIPFESFLQGPSRERFLQQLEAEQPTAPDPWLLIAEWHSGADRKEQAKGAIQRAQILLRTLTDPGDLQNRADKLAEKLELPKSDDLAPAKELLDSLGFISLASTEFPDRELAVAENALFYTEREGKLVTFAVRVVPQETSGTPNSYSMVHVECRNGSRVWGRGGLTQSSLIDGLGRVMFQARQIQDEPRFVFSTRVDKE